MIYHKGLDFSKILFTAEEDKLKLASLTDCFIQRVLFAIILYKFKPELVYDSQLLKQPRKLFPLSLSQSSFVIGLQKKCGTSHITIIGISRFGHLPL